MGGVGRLGAREADIAYGAGGTRAIAGKTAVQPARQSPDPQEVVERPRSSSSRTVAALTEGHDDEDDEEGVGHGQERVAEGGEDFGDGPQLAEDTQHAAAAQQQDQAQRDADRGEADDGEGDDDEVEDAPGVGDEGTPPVGEEVEEQLGREGDDQDKVDRVQDRPPPGA